MGLMRPRQSRAFGAASDAPRPGATPKRSSSTASFRLPKSRFFIGPGTFALTLLGTGDEGCFSECESGAGTGWSGTIAVAYTDNVPDAAVAEPAALALAGAALAGLAFARPRATR